MSVPVSDSSFETLSAADALEGEVDSQVKIDDLESTDVVDTGRQMTTLSSSTDSSVLALLLLLGNRWNLGLWQQVP